ncbi:DsbA family oxidoreductase [Portibacter marinus]|uniref:DsbA family oxidoreductase n=1 Tax=Portibacter marinus TaxID=2898660 RepID=UPI001F2CB0DF|nr:DsbA family oxidoreductase [Portibacter marinus]
MNKERIKIDIVSDVACPWCYVGKKHFEKALENMKDLDLEVNWKPFQLDPTIPENGLERETYLRNKFGSKERVDGMMERLKSFGEQVDIEFNDMNRIPNTRKMHNLMHVASEKGFANELKEAFFEGYFEKSLNMADDDIILDIAERFGWTRDEANAIMDDEEISYLVNQEIRDVQNRGVTGVPFFILNDQYGVSGAQPPEVLENWIRETKKELQKEEA